MLEVKNDFVGKRSLFQRIIESYFSYILSDYIQTYYHFGIYNDRL